MRYQIDTIPIWDALNLDSACLFCALRDKTENLLVERYLGASVMEPDTRIRVNDKGFCANHQQMLFAMENKLGHSLLMQSHLDVLSEKLIKAFDSASKAPKKSLFSKQAAKVDNTFESLIDTCIICDDLSENMKRFAYSFLHLYKTDNAFNERFLSSKGVCLVDLSLLVDMARDSYSNNLYIKFLDDMREMMLKKIDTHKEDIDWFTRKFDYRNHAAPWKNSRDALERTINLLRGHCIGAAIGKEEKTQNAKKK